MPDLIQKALEAKRESKHVEFKAGFDPTSPHDWCEIIKDIVAIANSGGGILVFGLDSRGAPTAVALDALACIDPADFTNRISKYTGSVDLQFEIRELRKDGHPLIAFVINPILIPVVFEKPGTYDIGGGNQKTAFGMGTVYFRHGAKSEPGNTGDIRSALERQLEVIRKSWIRGMRRVVQAPQGSQTTILQPSRQTASPASPMTFRAVKDPKAPPVLLTRDRKNAVGSFVHEEISEGIFDEINNVIDVNRILAKGQRHFLLGPSVYYRIYAERHHVSKDSDGTSLLFHSGICDLYAPVLFWSLTLPDKIIAQEFMHLYLNPKSPQIHLVMRLAVLLGKDFCEWLYDKWHRKWKRHPQPPLFYFTFKEMISKLPTNDARLVAARCAPSAQFEVIGEPAAKAPGLLENPQLAASLLSKACMRVFQGDTTMRPMARNLDYFAYGLQICSRRDSIAKAIVKAIGEQEAGDFEGASEKVDQGA